IQVRMSNTALNSFIRRYRQLFALRQHSDFGIRGPHFPCPLALCRSAMGDAPVSEAGARLRDSAFSARVSSVRYSPHAWAHLGCPGPWGPTSRESLSRETRASPVRLASAPA